MRGRVNPAGAGRAALTAAPRPAALPPRRAAPPELRAALPRPRPRARAQQVRPQLPRGTCLAAPLPFLPSGLPFLPPCRAPHLPQPLLRGGHPAGSSRRRGRAAPINVAPPVAARRVAPASPPQSFKIPPCSPAAAFNPPLARPRCSGRPRRRRWERGGARPSAHPRRCAPPRGPRPAGLPR